MTIFKKGSIVPRRLNALIAHNKKAQHFIVFGVDVVFDGKSIKPVKPLGERGHILCVRSKMSAPRKNGTRQHSGFSMGPTWILHMNCDPSQDIREVYMTRA